MGNKVAKGGLTKGKSHKEGGIPMRVKSTGQNIEVEGGEIIINKYSSADTKKHNFDGKQLTKCEIASKINEADDNGVKIDCDTIVGKKYKYDTGGKIKENDIEVKKEYQDLFEQYKENEDKNHHIDNAILLVRFFGTQDELDLLLDIKKLHQNQGYLTMKQSEEVYKIQQPYYRKMFKGYAKGGKLSTNSKEVREKVRQHILDSVYDENEEEFDTFSQASKELAKDFKRVADYPYNLQKIPNDQDRFKDYLQGIPFYFEFENYKLEKFLNGLGINPENKEYDSEQMYNLYSYLIWREIKDDYNRFAEGGKLKPSLRPTRYDIDRFMNLPVEEAQEYIIGQKDLEIKRLKGEMERINKIAKDLYSKFGFEYNSKRKKYYVDEDADVLVREKIYV